MNNIILGFYHLPHALLCDESCLGKEIDITILDIKGKLCFPNLKDEILPNKPRNPLLTCPIKEETWGNNSKNGETQWGRVVSYPNYSALISKLILKFENALEKDVPKIYFNIADWFNKFFALKEIFTRQSNYYSNMDIIKSTPPVDFYKYNSTIKKLSIDGENTISSIIEVGNQGLTFEECEKIAELTNSPKQISFEYDKYKIAIQSLDKKDYASVVVNSAIAIEKALVSKIKETCKNKNISFSKLSEKYKMLGGMFSLAEVLKISLPTTDYRTKINNLRNKVVHDGYFPQKQEAISFLNDTKKYLEAYSNIIE